MISYTVHQCFARHRCCHTGWADRYSKFAIVRTFKLLPETAAVYFASQWVARQFKRTVAAEIADSLPQVRRMDPGSVLVFANDKIHDWAQRVRPYSNRVQKRLRQLKSVAKHAAKREYDVDPHYGPAIADYLQSVSAELAGTNSTERLLQRFLQRRRKTVRRDSPIMGTERQAPRNPDISRPPAYSTIERQSYGSRLTQTGAPKIGGRGPPRTPADRERVALFNFLKDRYAATAQGRCFACLYLEKEAGTHNLVDCPNLHDALAKQSRRR